MNKTKIKLGDTVRDKVTRFTGTVTCRKEYLDGRTEYLIEPPMTWTGANIESKWFHYSRLEPYGWKWELWDSLRIVPR